MGAVGRTNEHIKHRKLSEEQLSRYVFSPTKALRKVVYVRMKE